VVAAAVAVLVQAVGIPMVAQGLHHLFLGHRLFMLAVAVVGAAISLTH
jgi:hypothetical protein